MRNSVFAAASFLREHAPVRIDKIRSPWRDLLLLQLYVPGSGTRHLSLSLAAGLFTVTVSGERPASGIPPAREHWKSLRLWIKGCRITGARVSQGGRGLELLLTGGRAAILVAVQGQLSVFDNGGGVLWSFNPKKEPASIRAFEEPPSDAVLLPLSRLEEALFNAEKERALAGLSRERKRIARAVEMSQKDLLRFSASLEIQGQAELLKSQMHKVGKGMDRVELDDYYHPGERVVIRLDPLRTPAENMERLFRKAGKYKRGFQLAKEREASLRNELDASDARLERIRSLEPGDIGSLLPVAASDTGSRRKRGDQPGEAPYARFHVQGCTVLVGRNSRGNESVTFRLASGNDLWLHARNFPGAHVVVRPEARGGAVPETVILDAAKLALFYSAARETGREEVVVIAVKHVRKIPGAGPGQVTYGKGRTLMVGLGEGFRPGDLFRENRDT